ncbi:hypothetical protein PQD80_gp62 [Arthrobacter phage Lizalica]|uniref:Uncharacterized protein n=1 Tax=Arthrobacter phage Lizalica TaxID=2832319 RepID=A0AA49B436_9CAUD|nr:hypothetical protein PQD80_gp62 [Arthrobacter phage Lizalica]UIW13546.1 hypothetical protein SEA_LIZALICA_62 [Arthrobacter phage Lizalica]
MADFTLLDALHVSVGYFLAQLLIDQTKALVARRRAHKEALRNA